MLQARTPGISGKTQAMIIKSLPLPEDMKLKLLSLLQLNCNSTLQDRNVFILLLLLVVINSEQEIVQRQLKITLMAATEH